MSDEDPEGSWCEFFEGNIPVPPHPSRSFDNDDVETTIFCLTLNSFEYQVESQVSNISIFELHVISCNVY